MKTTLIALIILLTLVSCLHTIDEVIADTWDNAVSITFVNGQTIINNPFKNKGVTITVDRQRVTVESIGLNKEVNYVLSGGTSDGFVKIYSDHKIGLVFNNVSIQNPFGAAINIQSGKKVSVMLTDNTTNRLVDGADYQMTAGEDMKGAFFSEGQLIFDGNGSLQVYGNNKHAICSDDYIHIKNGHIKIEHAISDGIHCNDYFEMDGGSIDISALSDGVECEKGYITINGGTLLVHNAVGDGKGIKSLNDLTINAGTLRIKVDGIDAEGLESKQTITINGGCIEVESNDNAINATDNITINGGEVYCYSVNNKGIASNGSLTITGGVIVSSGPRSSKGAFYFDNSSTFAITGGTMVGVSGTNGVPASTACTQPALVWTTSGFDAGQLISIKSTDAPESSDVLNFKMPRSLSSTTLIFSSPLLQTDTDYTIFMDGSLSGGNEFHGLFTDAVSSDCAELQTFRLSSMVTVVNNNQ